MGLPVKLYIHISVTDGNLKVNWLETCLVGEILSPNEDGVIVVFMAKLNNNIKASIFQEVNLLVLFHASSADNSFHFGSISPVPFLRP